MGVFIDREDIIRAEKQGVGIHLHRGWQGQDFRSTRGSTPSSGAWFASLYYLLHEG